MLEGNNEVIINGVRYVPAEELAQKVAFYFMHDNCTFTPLHGTTLDEILAHADRVEASEHGSYGMLCGAILLHGQKEVRRVGEGVHARGKNDPKDNWNAGKSMWREAMEKDSDVMRLLPSNTKLKGAPLGASSE